MTAPGRRDGERGQVAGVEVLPFGLLVFVAGTLLITNLWGVVDATFATDAAAREAARWAVERAGVERTDDDLRSGARALAERTLADHGRRGPVTVELAPRDAAFVRCTRVEVTVGVRVPAIAIPFVGGFGDAFHVTATHSELVDPTRSGVAGGAACIR